MRVFERKPIRWAIALTVLLIVIAIASGLVLASLGRGPEQPIPFSHRIHVHTKEINCFFCHQYATRSLHPGMPPVERCWLCHKIIASQLPPIAKIRWYYRRNEPIPWVRVGRVPDFVFFSHQPHLAFKIDCSRCHGNVRLMDRIKNVQEFSMGFCTDCHDSYGVSVDCYTCHR